MQVKLDIAGLVDQLEQFKEELIKDINKGVRGLAQATFAHIKEDAQTLNSSRQKYLEDLSEPEEIDDGVWVITLKESSLWIEDGSSQPYDMKPGLLKKGKDGKNGKYRIVPMNQGKTSSEMSPRTAGYEQNVINLLKSELKKQGIPYKKLEVDKNGSPRHGGVDEKTGKGIPLRLHKDININSFAPGKGSTGQLMGLNIYQTKQKDGSVKRTLTTFRTVTEHGQEGKWIHPPVEPLDAFNKAYDFAVQEWESKWLPMILDKYR